MIKQFFFGKKQKHKEEKQKEEKHEEDKYEEEKHKEQEQGDGENEQDENKEYKHYFTQYMSGTHTTKIKNKKSYKIELLHAIVKYLPKTQQEHIAEHIKKDNKKEFKMNKIQYINKQNINRVNGHGSNGNINRNRFFNKIPWSFINKVVNFKAQYIQLPQNSIHKKILCEWKHIFDNIFIIHTANDSFVGISYTDDVKELYNDLFVMYRSKKVPNITRRTLSQFFKMMNLKDSENNYVYLPEHFINYDTCWYVVMLKYLFDDVKTCDSSVLSREITLCCTTFILLASQKSYKFVRRKIALPPTLDIVDTYIHKYVFQTDDNDGGIETLKKKLLLQFDKNNASV